MSQGQSFEGRKLGDFELIRELGRGGMGVVYEAKQLSLGRNVALKVLVGTLGLSSRAIQRFKREAEAAGRLHHTNIVPVYAIGEDDGVHFYAMELIDGPSLDRVLHQSGQANLHTISLSPASEATSPLQDAEPESGGRPEAAPSASSAKTSGSTVEEFDHIASLMAEVAEALDYAHDQGIIHRDIKPSNLLLGPNGKLSINDFGLARVLEAPNMTATGEMLGTPAYMSPEQITAGRTPLDHRTDIYSLGATLYEMLTLQPPFTGERRDQLLAQILHKDPIPPRKVNKRIPVDLETICLKAIDKDPDKRYQSAGALAKDLKRYVDRFEISARRVGAFGKARKWVDRNRAVASLLACVAAIGCLALYFLYSAHLYSQELAANRIQEVMQSAMFDTLSGDIPSSLAKISEAQSLGATAGDLDLLRGLVEQSRGNTREALVYLKNAERQLPDNVAAQALLALCYCDTGHWEKLDRALPNLSNAEPTSDIDRLCLARALSEIEPTTALTMLAGLTARSRQSNLGRLAVAHASHFKAVMTGDIQDAKLGLDELVGIKGDHNSWLFNTRMMLRLTASRSKGISQDDRAFYLEQARKDFNELLNIHDNTVAVRGRIDFASFTGSQDLLFDELKKARLLGQDTYYARLYAGACLYGKGQEHAAIEYLEPDKTLQSDLSAVSHYCLALSQLDERRDEARKLLVDACTRSSGGSSLALYPSWLSLLSPDQEKVHQQIATRILEEKLDLIPSARGGWYRSVLEFQAGIIDQEELIRIAGPNLFNQCEATFQFGIHALANGNRKLAKKNFEECVATNVVFYYEHVWSLAFLQRIDDPRWLPWIPMNAPISERSVLSVGASP